MNHEDKHSRILRCRFYNGEKEFPEKKFALFTSENPGTFWYYEQLWVERMYKDNWDMDIDEMTRAGIFSEFDKSSTPNSLIALLYNRWRHWGGAYSEAEDFVKWMFATYEARPTNYERRFEQRKKKLTAKCRYYKGEQENPYEGTEDQMKWYYESCWVEQLSESYENAKMFRHEIGNKFDDIAEKYNVPRSLIGLLLNRYEHWCCMGEVNLGYFREWVLQDYLKIKE